MGDGSYFVSYTVPEQMTCLIHITYEGTEIKGSPFKVECMNYWRNIVLCSHTRFSP